MQKVYFALGVQQWAKAYDPDEAFQDWLEGAYKYDPKECVIVEICAPEGSRHADNAQGLWDACTIGPMGGLTRPADTDSKNHTKTLDQKLIVRMAKLKDNLEDVISDLSGDIWEVFEE